MTAYSLGTDHTYIRRTFVMILHNRRQVVSIKGGGPMRPGGPELGPLSSLETGIPNWLDTTGPPGCRERTSWSAGRIRAGCGGGGAAD